ELRHFRAAGGQIADYPKARSAEKPWSGSHGNRYVCVGCGHGQYHANAEGCRKCGEALKDERGSNDLHPTVKPLALMRHLVRLVTPPGGSVLDLFAGTGTPLEAALTEGFSAVGIEKEPGYVDLIRRRLSKPIEVTL